MDKYANGIHARVEEEEQEGKQGPAKRKHRLTRAELDEIRSKAADGVKNEVGGDPICGVQRRPAKFSETASQTTTGTRPPTKVTLTRSQTIACRNR